MGEPNSPLNGELDLTPPKESLGDHLHTGFRAAISALPIIGGPAAELYSAVIVPPLRGRQQAWMESIAESLEDLRAQKKLNVGQLKDNDAFIDTIMQATQAAVRTANEEKREALKNAVLNAALPNPPEEAKRQMFVNFIDQFTVWHLRILHLFAAPADWFSSNRVTPPRYSLGGSLSGILVAAFAELKDQRELYDLIGKDLYFRGLLNTEGFHALLSGDGAMAKRTTPLGDEFIRFVSPPNQ